MVDLDVSVVNSVYLRVQCERGIARELSDFFSFKVPGYKYMTAYRSRMWDGEIRLYNVHTQEIYAGLGDYLVKFAAERGYTIMMPTENAFQTTPEAVRQFVEDFLQVCVNGEKAVAHAHQINAIHHAMQAERCLLLSPTGSGKSLIIYALLRYYLDKIPKDKRILIIVPTISLVEQMYSDFVDYSHDNKWQVNQNCHKITAGVSKQTDKRVVISTWQSLFRQTEKYFEQFGAVVGDECVHPHTLITMGDGTEKQIKDIVAGDLVKTTNEETRKIENKPIIKVHHNLSISEQMYEIILSDGKSIKITGNHKVMLSNGVWKRADELEIGENIHTYKGV